MAHSPDRGVHTAVVELLVVQLSKERKQDLDASYRVDGTVDGVGNNGLHVLWDGSLPSLLYAHTLRQRSDPQWIICCYECTVYICLVIIGLKNKCEKQYYENHYADYIIIIRE